MPDRALLVAAAAFNATMRGPQVAAAIGRGLESAGLAPPDLCAVADGGPGTIEALVLGLGGETADGFALVEDGAVAIVEAGAGLAAAARSGAALIAFAGTPGPEVNLRGARLIGLDARFVLDALDFDARLRAARGLIVADGICDERWLEGAVAGEIATRARQAGVPCHAIVGRNALDALGARILDLQRIVEAPTLAACEAAGAALAEVL